MKNCKRILAGALIFAMGFGVCALNAGEALGAKKPKLSKKSVTVKVGKKKTIQVKGIKKNKIKKISVSTNKKKIVAVKKKGKNAFTVQGKKKGNAKVTVKVFIKKGKKKTLTLKVKVTKDVTLSVAEQTSIKESYQGIFENFGTCANYVGYGNKAKQLQTPEIVEFIKKHYNSITLENEMKPEAILTKDTLKVEDAKAKGYLIPDSYKESTVPALNFDVVDKTLAFCHENQIRLRAHTLVWHSQTPALFFYSEYDTSKSILKDTAQMDARMEFYITNVMHHVMDQEKTLNGNPGSIVYAWDVVNEYLHHSKAMDNGNWVDVYGEQKKQPTYVKKAYEIAYNVLKEYNATDKVALVFNDYNTYDEVDDIIEVVKYINEGEEANICSAIGMQAHVDCSYPSVAKFETAVKKFMETGLEVQITELDVTINFVNASAGQTAADQAKYVSNLMTMLVKTQKERDTKVSPKGITGITIWGLYDDCSWRATNKPLFFSSGITKPKASYFALIQASGNEASATASTTPSTTPSASPSALPSATSSASTGTEASTVPGETASATPATA